MGEYFKWINADKKEYLSPNDFGLGNKSHESLHKGNPLLRALYELLSTCWCGDMIGFIGDEGSVSNYEEAPFLRRLYEETEGDYYDFICEIYRNVSCLFQSAEAEVRGEIEYYLETAKSTCHSDLVNEYGVDITNPFSGLFIKTGKEYPYIINHTKKQYYALDITQVLYSDGSVCGYADPLPVLMAYGRSVKAGAWLGDIIGVADMAPVGYAFLPMIIWE